MAGHEPRRLRFFNNGKPGRREARAREDRVEFVPVARAGQGLSIAATATSTRGHATETTEAFLQTPVPNSTILSISFGRMSSSTGLLARAKADRFEEPLAGERERKEEKKKKKARRGILTEVDQQPAVSLALIRWQGQYAGHVVIQE